MIATSTTTTGSTGSSTINSENKHVTINDTTTTTRPSTITIDQIVEQFESHYSSPRQLALLRIQLSTGTTSSSDGNYSNQEDDEESEEHPFICGLAAVFVPAMTTAVSHFKQLHQPPPPPPQQQQQVHDTNGDGELSIVSDSFGQLHQLLLIYLRWVQIDAILAEEFGRYGAHSLLIQLLEINTSTSTGTISTPQSHYGDVDNNDDEIIQKNDNIETIQDIAGEIAAACRPHFPLSITTPFTIHELQQRLPLFITIPAYPRLIIDDNNPQHPYITNNNPITVLIHQICSRQSAQVDVGFVLWPSAVVLSSLIVNTSWLYDLVRKHATNIITVLELGAGCGLSGLVAALCLRRYASKSVSVILSDFNSLVLENLQQNIQLNDLTDICSVVGLDFYQQSGRAEQQWITMNTAGTATSTTIPTNKPSPSDQVDVVIAADIICQPSDAVAVANTIHDTLKPGGVAYIVCADAKHRFGVDHLYGECQRVGLTISTTSITDYCDEADADINHSGKTIRLHENDTRNLKQTTGYVHGMKLTLFRIKKD